MTAPFLRLGAMLFLACVTQLPAGASLTTALDDDSMSWTTGGDRPWLELAAADAKAGGTVAQLRFLDEANDGCSSAWLETTVVGPGVFAIWVRENGNPYVELELTVDGQVAHDPMFFCGWTPDESFNEWIRVTRPESLPKCSRSVDAVAAYSEALALSFLGTDGRWQRMGESGQLR